MSKGKRTARKSNAVATKQRHASSLMTDFVRVRNARDKAGRGSQ